MSRIDGILDHLADGHPALPLLADCQALHSPVSGRPPVCKLSGRAALPRSSLEKLLAA